MSRWDDVLVWIVPFALMALVVLLSAAHEMPKGCAKGHGVERWYGQTLVCDEWVKPQMGIDYGILAHPKGPLGVEVKRQKRVTDESLEDAARKAVRLRDGYHCVVPGCKDAGVHMHHIVYRSRSKKLKWAHHNLCYLCVAHHRLEHAGKITIHPRTAEGELIVTGEAKYLRFKL